MNNVAKVTPQVGMGATSGFGSDCYPYTIIEVSKDGKKVKVQSDAHAPVKEGFDFYANQQYDYTANPNGSVMEFRLRKNGSYVRQGDPMRGGQRLSIGNRRYYRDPSF